MSYMIFLSGKDSANNMFHNLFRYTFVFLFLDQD